MLYTMKNITILIALLLIGGGFANGEIKKDNIIHHNIRVKLDVDQSKIQVCDSINLSEILTSGSEQIQFYLNKNLVIDESNYRIEESTDTVSNSKWKKYTLFVDTDKFEKLILNYNGIIADQKERLSAPPRHGQSNETSGIVFEKGIYLSGNTAWVPRFDIASLVTFNIEAEIDADWNIVSQGTEVSNILANGKKVVVYESDKPANQIYLMGNKWTKYSIKSGDVLVQAFLITPDEKLANQYLSATSRYLKMYEKLIGVYPYSKFALVENFWETGYGMPSFTLLGQRVIRMPWIIASSYPHELLHNYWGNGVFVDYSKGNWSEGITTYMADHLLKEMKGEGAKYRLASLQKYSSYVNSKNDFPVCDFKSRTTNASSAIGYDKVVMFNHMLRVKYGEEVFLKAYADFYKTYCFKKVSFDEIRTSFEKITGDDLSSYFNQWINRVGVPQISIENLKSFEENGIAKLTFTIKQTQEEDVFAFDLPISLILKGKTDLVTKSLAISKRSQNFVFDFESAVERVEFDPNFDVMRKLDSREVPATISGLLGANCVVILPGSSSELADYSVMAQAFKNSQLRQRKKVNILTDSEMESFPNSEYIWVLGSENKYAEKAYISEKIKLSLTENAQTSFENLDGSLFHIQSVDNQKIAFLKSNDTKKIVRILSKIKHYGSYSFLGFEGVDNKNTLKGVFPILNSPMIFNLRTNFNQKPTKINKRSLLGEMQ